MGFWDDDADRERELYFDALDAIGDTWGEDLSEQIAQDSWAQSLYDIAMYDFELTDDERANAYFAFETHMMDEYGVEWEDYFDWHEYYEELS